MNLDPRYKPRELGDRPRRQRIPLLQKRVGKPVQQHRVKTGVEKDHFATAESSGVSVTDRIHIGKNGIDPAAQLLRQRYVLFRALRLLFLYGNVNLHADSFLREQKNVSRNGHIFHL